MSTAIVLLSVLWAQRSNETEAEKNIVYLSVNAIDLQHPKIELTETGVTVEGVQKGTEAVYKVALEFFEGIDVKARVPPSLLFILWARALCVQSCAMNLSPNLQSLVKRWFVEGFLE